MSTSLPSKLVFAIDVPTVKDLAVEFRYNFFSPDEQVSDTGGIPQYLLNKSVGEVDADSPRYFETRVPRYVVFTWNKPRLKDPGNQTTDKEIKKVATRSHTNSTLISDNYDSIVAEDHFSAFDYVSVIFHDSDIDAKLYNMVSGSYAQHLFEDPAGARATAHSAAGKLTVKVPGAAKLINTAHHQVALSHGAHHYNIAPGGQSHATQDSKKPLPPPRVIEKLKAVFVNTQINSRLLDDVTGRIIQDPHSPFSTDVTVLNKHAKSVAASSRGRVNQTVNDAEFKRPVKYVALNVNNTSHHSQRTVAEHVGYVIDKYEINTDGSIKQLKPIIIENPEAHLAIDSRVKYGQQYRYSMRSIALFTLPAIDYDTGEVSTIQVLVSSKPSKQFSGKVVSNVAPPPPTDINFTWNFEVDKLLVHWTFPPNSQRDVKRFQVFRRSTVNEPFQLLVEYDFDDSRVTFDDHESVDPRLKRNMLVTSPATFYTDDDFTKDSRYIYTVCSIDAHGLTSCYGAQYELRFDRFKNSLVKSLVSHAGAPKPYPNLYLPGDGFVNCARVEGPSSKRMRIFFVPQHYVLTDDNGHTYPVITTNQTNGYYKFQFINVDNQKSDSLSVFIDDRVTKEVPAIAHPRSINNPVRRLPGLPTFTG